MKEKLVFLGFLAVICVFSQESNSNVDLVSKNRTRYVKGQTEPFSGKLVKYFKSGSIEAEATLVDGKFYGPETCYYENGNKRSLMYYRNDKPHGTIKIWNEDGKLVFEGQFKDELLYQEGKLFTGQIVLF